MLKAVIHCCILVTFFGELLGSKVSSGLPELPAVEDIDKAYFSDGGATVNNAPKSIYSLAQIFDLSLALTHAPKFIPILVNICCGCSPPL